MNFEKRLESLTSSMFKVGKLRVKARDDGKVLHSAASLCARSFPERAYLLEKHLNRICLKCGPKIRAVGLSWNVEVRLEDLLSAYEWSRDQVLDFDDLKTASLLPLLRQYIDWKFPDVRFASTFGQYRNSLYIATQLGWEQQLKTANAAYMSNVEECLKTERLPDVLMLYAEAAVPDLGFPLESFFKNSAARVEEVLMREREEIAKDARRFLVAVSGRRLVSTSPYRDMRVLLNELPHALFQVHPGLLVVPAVVAAYLRANQIAGIARIGNAACRPEVYEAVSALYDPFSKGPYSSLPAAIRAATKI